MSTTAPSYGGLVYTSHGSRCAYNIAVGPSVFVDEVRGPSVFIDESGGPSMFVDERWWPERVCR